MAMALCLTFSVGYSVRQLVSALDTIETVSKFEESSLHEKYPEYFDLTGFKGLEVYVTQTTPDNYSCVLKDYTNRSNPSSNILSYSGARVTVYKGNKHSADYAVPAGRIGREWHVFDIVDGELVPVNTIS